MTPSLTDTEAGSAVIAALSSMPRKRRVAGQIVANQGMVSIEVGGFCYDLYNSKQEQLNSQQRLLRVRDVLLQSFNDEKQVFEFGLLDISDTLDNKTYHLVNPGSYYQDERNNLLLNPSSTFKAANTEKQAFKMLFASSKCRGLVLETLLDANSRRTKTEYVLELHAGVVESLVKHARYPWHYAKSFFGSPVNASATSTTSYQVFSQCTAFEAALAKSKQWKTSDIVLSAIAGAFIGVAVGEVVFRNYRWRLQQNPLEPQSAMTASSDASQPLATRSFTPSQIRINFDTTGQQEKPYAVNTGVFSAIQKIWYTYISHSSGVGRATISRTRIDGTPVGAEFQATNSSITGQESDARITQLTNGNVVTAARLSSSDEINYTLYNVTTVTPIGELTRLPAPMSSSAKWSLTSVSNGMFASSWCNLNILYQELRHPNLTLAHPKLAQSPGSTCRQSYTSELGNGNLLTCFDQAASSRFMCQKSNPVNGTWVGSSFQLNTGGYVSLGGSSTITSDGETLVTYSVSGPGASSSIYVSRLDQNGTDVGDTLNAATSPSTAWRVDSPVIREMTPLKYELCWHEYLNPGLKQIIKCQLIEKRAGLLAKLYEALSLETQDPTRMANPEMVKTVNGTISVLSDDYDASSDGVYYSTTREANFIPNPASPTPAPTPVIIDSDLEKLITFFMENAWARTIVGSMTTGVLGLIAVGSTTIIVLQVKKCRNTLQMQDQSGTTDALLDYKREYLVPLVKTLATTFKFDVKEPIIDTESELIDALFHFINKLERNSIFKIKETEPRIYHPSFIAALKTLLPMQDGELQSAVNQQASITTALTTAVDNDLVTERFVSEMNKGIHRRSQAPASIAGPGYQPASVELSLLLPPQKPDEAQSHAPARSIYPVTRRLSADSLTTKASGQTSQTSAQEMWQPGRSSLDSGDTAVSALTNETQADQSPQLSM